MRIGLSRSRGRGRVNRVWCISGQEEIRIRIRIRIRVRVRVRVRVRIRIMPHLFLFHGLVFFVLAMLCWFCMVHISQPSH